MAKYCSNCGNEVRETDNVCSNCGTRLKGEQTNAFEDQVKGVINDVKNNSDEFTEEEKNSGKGMAILAYIGLLFLIPLLAEKENKFVRYHIAQGINLFLWCLIGEIVLSFVPFVGGAIAGLMGLLQVALMIIGIVNVCNGEAKELPVINKLPVLISKV